MFPGNPQYAAFWACAAFFIGLHHVEKETGRPRLFWTLVLAASLWTLYSMPVRSGWLALSAGLVVFLWSRFGRRGLIGAGGVLLLGLTFMPVRFLKSDDPYSLKRVDIWRASLSGIKEKPLLGWGPGQFETLYWRKGLPQEGEPVRFERTTAFAHNDYLQLLAETGIPGGLFLLWAILGLWRSRLRDPAHSGASAVWVAVGTFCLVNFPLVLPVNGALLGGLLAAEPGRWRHRRIFPYDAIFPPRVFRLLLTLGVLGFGAVGVGSFWGDRRWPGIGTVDSAWVDRRLADAGTRLHSADPNGQAEAERILNGLRPWNAHRADLWRDWGHLEWEHRSPPRWDAADESYRRALDLKPRQAPWWMEWAGLREQRGDRRAVKEFLRRALALEPHYVKASLAFGDFIRRGGDPEGALAWFDRLKEQSRRWPTAPASGSGYQRTILERDERGLALARMAALMDLKRYADALREAESMTPQDLDTVSVRVGCLHHLGRRREADRVLKEGTDRWPQDPRWAVFRRRLASKPGREP